MRATLPYENCLKKLLERLNAFLVQDLPDYQFVSLFLSILDAATAGSITPPPAMMRSCCADGRDAHLGSTAMLLGIVPVLESEVATLVLEPGDTLLLATDGITETFSLDEKQFGWRRMVQVVRDHAHLPACAQVQALHQHVRAYAGGQPQADDISLIVVKCLEASD